VDRMTSKSGVTSKCFKFRSYIDREGGANCIDF
jgi:hypothetical protein